MIRILLGNLGSGKTASAVRHMAVNDDMIFYSNIITKLKNNRTINSGMIVKKEIVDYKKNKKTGELEPVYSETMNKEFWMAIKEPISIILDEAHTIINSREAMKKQNKIVTEWIALLRRVVGQSSTHDGELVLITQLPHRIDVIAREMATKVQYHRCYYVKECTKCGTYWNEHSDMAEHSSRCRRCNSRKIAKSDYRVLVWNFRNMQEFEQWFYLRKKSYYRMHMITDVEEYFHLYNTVQWDNLFS